MLTQIVPFDPSKNKIFLMITYKLIKINKEQMHLKDYVRIYIQRLNILAMK